MRFQSKRIFVFVGELSGDLHGSLLVRAIKEKCPGIHIEGVAGPRMRAENVQGPLVMEDFLVMGLSDVLRALPRLFKHFFTIRRTILETSPDAVILVDYPGFNLRMANSLRKKGYSGKIIQYISPSVWAWGSYRAIEMAKTFDLLMTIYPFEAPYFSKTTLKVDYVGSPVKEQIALHQYKDDWKSEVGIPDSKQIVALFPGSRSGEIKRNLQIILEAAVLLKQKHPEVIFGISCADDFLEQMLHQVIDRFVELKNSIFIVPKKYRYELMRDSRCAVAKSGTVTFELALHQRPTVVVYRLTPLNRFYAKYILRTNLPFYCIVNVFLGNEIFPELIKKGLTAANIFGHLRSLYSDSPEREQCLKGCQRLSQKIGSSRTSIRAAESVMELL
ncbi:MAG: lipid-A-disaccharide synthase [Parachlamydiaceae bacterium]